MWSRTFLTPGAAHAASIASSCSALDRYRRMDPRAIVDTAMSTVAGGVLDEVRADYLDAYESSTPSL
jgi:hypothetical protein